MQPRISHKAFLAGLRYPGYNFIDQAASELFGIGAPAGRIVVPLFTLSSTLLAAFGFAVGTGSGHNRVWPSAWPSTVINSGRPCLPSFSCVKGGR